MHVIIVVDAFVTIATTSVTSDNTPHICIEFIHVKEGSFYVVSAKEKQDREIVCNLVGR